MRFVTVIKPAIVTASSGAKNVIIEKARRKHRLSVMTFSSYGHAAYCNDTVVIGINMEKHRKKVKRTYRDSNYVQHSEILEQAKWVGFVYSFPIEFLRANNLCVVQGVRTFKLVRNRA